MTLDRQTGGKRALCRVRLLRASALLLVLTACSDGSSPTDVNGAKTPASITVHAGANQTALPGAAVQIRPAVIVRNAAGSPIEGASVQFAVAAGGGQLTGATASTNAAGIAEVGSWVLGASGAQRITARAGTLTAINIEATLLEELAEYSIGGGGGTVEFEEPGPYDGLTLTIPAGAFPAGSDWSIRVDGTAPGVTLPAGFAVAGPVLEVRTSVTRTDSLMTLDIPVANPTGKTIVIAVRDPIRGVMEVLPTVRQSTTSVRVMAGHLRGDLLLGPPVSEALRAVVSTNGVSGSSEPREGGMPGPRFQSLTFSGIAQLIPIEMLIPTAPASTEINRWPVLDHGSSAFPEGFGPAIAALQVAATARKVSSLVGSVRLLDTPGFYAEPGPMAALMLANRAVLQSLESVTRQLSTELQELPKAQQDELVHRNVVANLHLSTLPTLVGTARQAGQAASLIGAAIAGSDTDLTLSVPTETAPISHARATGGFLPRSLSTVIGGVQIEMSSLIPLTSLVAPLERINTIAERVGQLANHAVESIERQQFNEQLAAEAGLALPELEFRADGEAEWRPVTGGSFVARSRDAAIRVVGRAASLHGLTGARIGEGVQIALSQDGALFEGAPGTPVARTVSTAVAGIGGIVRQVGSLTLRMAGALFTLETAEVTLAEGEREVDFRASVPSPPAGGYRIEWDWGDGTTTQTVNTPVASHEYDVANDYTVTAVLHTTGGDRLAEATGRVKAAAQPLWRITSFVDQDNLLDDEEIEGSGPTVDLLTRLLAAPGAGLIAVEPRTGGGTQLILRAHRTATWSGNEPQPPPPSSAIAEHLQVLGTDPAVPHVVGPFFAGWESDVWTQSTSDPASGTMSGRYALGHVTYQIEDGGAQRGPAGGVRFQGTRNGGAMVGTVTVVIWWADEDTGEVSEPGEEFRFQFEAVRWGAQP